MRIKMPSWYWKKSTKTIFVLYYLITHKKLCIVLFESNSVSIDFLEKQHQSFSEWLSKFLFHILLIVSLHLILHSIALHLEATLINCIADMLCMVIPIKKGFKIGFQPRFNFHTHIKSISIPPQSTMSGQNIKYLYGIKSD